MAMTWGEKQEVDQVGQSTAQIDSSETAYTNTAVFLTMLAKRNGCRRMHNAYLLYPAQLPMFALVPPRCARFRSTPLYGAYRLSKNPVVGALFALVFFLR